jgi:hypothetical protein
MLRTLVRRHRRGIAVGAAIGTAAAVGLALAALQFLRAREAEARSDLLVGQLVEGSRPIVVDLQRTLFERGESLSARKAAVEATLGYLRWVREVAGDDERVLEAVARALTELGQVVGSAGAGSLGDVEGAVAALGEARTLFESLIARRSTASRHRGLSDVLALLAMIEIGERKAELLAEAAAEFRRGLALMPPGEARDREERTILVREFYAATAAGDAEVLRASLDRFAALEPRWRNDAEYWSEVGLAWRYLTQILEQEGDPAACEAAEACRVALERSNALGLDGNFSNERHLARNELSEVVCRVGHGRSPRSNGPATRGNCGPATTSIGCRTPRRCACSVTRRSGSWTRSEPPNGGCSRTGPSPRCAASSTGSPPPRSRASGTSARTR